MGAVLGVLVALGVLAIVGCVALWSAARDRPGPSPLDPSPHDESVVIAIGVERAEGVADLGRNDERRCGF